MTAPHSTENVPERSDAMKHRPTGILAIQLRILMPTGLVIDEPATRVNAEAEDGWFCLLPRHVDMVTSLAPGILTWTNHEQLPRFAGIADGVLVKTGKDVQVSAQFAVAGDDLLHLKQKVQAWFEDVNERERQALSAVARLESDFVRRYLELESHLHV